jgi:hypothetical protein
MNLAQEQIDSVWQHGRVMPEADPSIWRQDARGAWMQRDQFGHENSEFGWKIENVVGSGAYPPENLRPFHWRNHFDAANKKPHCQVTADRAGVPSDQRASPPCNRSVQARTR